MNLLSIWYVALLGTFFSVYLEMLAPCFTLATNSTTTAFPPFVRTCSSDNLTVNVCPFIVILLLSIKSFSTFAETGVPLFPNSNSSTNVSVIENSVAFIGTVVSIL